MHLLLLLMLLAYGAHGQTTRDLWAEDSTEFYETSSPATQAPSVALEDCTLIDGQEGKCVESLKYCKTSNYGAGKIMWRTCQTGECYQKQDVITTCQTGVCCRKQDVIRTCQTGECYRKQDVILSGPLHTITTAGPTPPTPLIPPMPSTEIPNGPLPTTTTAGITPPTPPIPPMPSTERVSCGIQKRQTVAGFTKTKANEADPGEFPWTVNLMTLGRTIGTKGVYYYAGTGSLIHDRVVLTAAHVLQNQALTKLRVIPGEYDQMTRVVFKKLVEVSDVVVHKNFNSSNGNNNIALVFLKSSATKDLISHVGTVCLPPANYVPTPGSSCVFSGWDINSANILQNRLSKTEVPMVSHLGCQERLRQSPKLGPGFQLLPTFTCAGGEAGKDICAGGGGSPLVCPIEGQNRYVQTGIVSWVVDCGADGYPVVFTDVAVARPWIDQQMAEHQYSTASYTY